MWLHVCTIMIAFLVSWHQSGPLGYVHKAFGDWSTHFCSVSERVTILSARWLPSDDYRDLLTAV